MYSSLQVSWTIGHKLSPVVKSTIFMSPGLRRTCTPRATFECRLPGQLKLVFFQ